MGKITLPMWAFLAVAFGVTYLYGVFDLQNRLPMPGKAKSSNGGLFNWF